MRYPLDMKVATQTQGKRIASGRDEHSRSRRVEIKFVYRKTCLHVCAGAAGRSCVGPRRRSGMARWRDYEAS